MKSKFLLHDGIAPWPAVLYKPRRSGGIVLLRVAAISPGGRITTIDGKFDVDGRSIGGSLWDTTFLLEPTADNLNRWRLDRTIREIHEEVARLHAMRFYDIKDLSKAREVLKELRGVVI